MTLNDLFCSCVDKYSILSCPKRWFQFNSRIVSKAHFSGIIRNAKIHFQVTFSLPSTSCLVKLPTDTALRTANWPRLNMTNNMTRHQRPALYGAGIMGAYFLLIFNTHNSFQSCNRRSTIGIPRSPRQHFLK